MTLITPDLSGIVDGQTADATDFTNPINTIINDYNGGITNDNISSTAAIGQEKIATNTLGYASVTANQGSITSVADLTSLSVTVTVPSGGRRIRISGKCNLESTVAADDITLNANEGATQLATCKNSSGVANKGHHFRVEYIVAATAGSHTYKLQAGRTSGTGTITMTASATDPAWIHVEVI